MSSCADQVRHRIVPRGDPALRLTRVGQIDPIQCAVRPPNRIATQPDAADGSNFIWGVKRRIAKLGRRDVSSRVYNRVSLARSTSSGSLLGNSRARNGVPAGISVSFSLFWGASGGGGVGWGGFRIALK